MICSKPGKSTWQGYWPGHPRVRHTRFHDRLQYGQVLIGHSGCENAGIIIHFPMWGETFLVVMQLMWSSPQWECLAKSDLRATFTVHTDGEQLPNMVLYIRLNLYQPLMEPNHLQHFSTGNLCAPPLSSVNRVLVISASCSFRAFCGGATRRLLAIQAAVVERCMVQS